MAYTLIKKYEDYDAYVAGQASKNKKLSKSSIGRQWEGRVKKFLLRFKDLHISGRVICLGARQGCEVEAFNRLGGKAVGIDIAPMHPLVEVGDFHRIQYGSDTFDVVYSNSIDHSNNPVLFLEEATRVLKPDGLLVIDLQYNQLGEYEVIKWDSEDSVVAIAPKELKYLGKTYPHKMYKNRTKEPQFIWKKHGTKIS